MVFDCIPMDGRDKEEPAHDVLGWFDVGKIRQIGRSLR